MPILREFVLFSLKQTPCICVDFVAPEFIEGGLNEYLASEGAIVSGFPTPEFGRHLCICVEFNACLAGAMIHLGKGSLKTFSLPSHPSRLVFEGSILKRLKKQSCFAFGFAD